MDPDDWRIVKATPLFGAMSIEVVQRLVGNVSPMSYGKGALLFQQGEPASGFFVILSGMVKIYRISPQGEEAVLGIYKKGETFAEAAMFLGGRYPASAEVVAGGRILRIDGETLRRHIKERPEIALSMLASSSYHLKFLVEQIEQIKLLSAPRRVARFLLELCRVQSGPCIVELPYEKALLANRLGMKPESFSRAISKLKPLGVTVEREQVKIADVRSLANYAGRSEDDEE
ncbi:MAG: Crp/Fnr family transcriptional regulator [Hyphomicrobiales bacterium]|nr:MAG: Crp/Fnr family transcriptional regulator [Hyphomicrobiales bacterium]